MPKGKYYLGDASYSFNNQTLLIPYQRVRYHLKEFYPRQEGKKPEDKRELFNLRHAQLRGFIKRLFSVWKKRFRILQLSHHGFYLQTQIKLVLALAVVHNFLNNNGEDPWDEPIEIFKETKAPTRTAASGAPKSSRISLAAQRREDITEAMWQGYQDYIRRERVIVIAAGEAST
jgi:hypothetical protein